ncbi:MAG: hypothetical protein E6224_00255 [Haemophilus parainfluenzae]|jgi:hypothetical protein|nr:hypothetical protein [Haemophilus parainfluenzae]
MPEITIICPIIFTLSENDPISREESISFINQLEENFSKGRDLVIDFRQTIEAYAESTLILFGQIHSMRYRNNYKKCRSKLTIIYPVKEQNPSGYMLFISTGLNKAIEASSELDIIELTSRNNFYQSGDANRLVGMMLNNWEMISREEISSGQKFLLHQGVSEAILNVRNHAYIKSRALQNKIGQGRWYQCSWYQQSKRMFVFLIYDLGCGILGSYPESSLDDKERLKQAMTEGFTRYNNRKRGKGSENIKQVISRAVENESLTVYTDNLIYQYYYNNSTISDVCITSQVQTPIKGTLVAWTLTLLEDK